MAIVNLNKHRKAKAASRSKAEAAENRVRFGRTKVEKAFDAARAASRNRLDQPPQSELKQDQASTGEGNLSRARRRCDE